MIKLNVSFSEILKKIILSDSKMKYLYTNKFPHSKYSLDNILKEILYVLKTGLSWREIRSPIKWETIYWHFNRLSSRGIFKKLFLHLRKGYVKNHIIDIKLNW